MEILKANDLRIYFQTPYGTVKAVDGVSFGLPRGRTLGIVGQSGAGKSITALTVLGLAEAVGARVISGEVWYKGRNLLAAPAAYRQVRGKNIAYIPQENAAALNPMLTVEKQLEEMLRVHLDLSAAARRLRIRQLLEMVELPDPDLICRMYPHQLSGGIMQRVLLAMALSCRPEIIIADEPASSLDTTVQAEILSLLGNIRNRNGLAMILIAHDLGLIYQNCDHLLIMYAGRVLENGPVQEVLDRPLHPYTAELIDVYRSLGQGSCGRLHRIIATADNSGCVFRSSCPRATDVCCRKRPVMVSGDRGHAVACHHSFGW